MALKLGWKAACAAAAAAAVTAAVTHPAAAQTPDDLARLERFSADRNRALAMHTQRVPPMSTQQPERLQQPDRLWVCRGTQAGQPIFSSPDFRSGQSGVTQDYVAVSGATVNGFNLVLGYSGRLGFVPTGSLGPFVSKVKPGVQCTVEGLRRRDGSPVFGFR